MSAGRRVARTWSDDTIKHHPQLGAPNEKGADVKLSRSRSSGSTTDGGRFRPTPSAAPVSRSFMFVEE